MRQLFPFTLLLLLIPPVPQSTGGSPQESTNAASFHHVHLNSTDPSKATAPSGISGGVARRWSPITRSASRMA